MDSQSVSQLSLSTDNKPNCKCSEGWKCTITKTVASQISKPFSTCGGSCTCVTETKVPETLEGSAGGKVFCECGEGWSCVVTNTEGPEAGKIYFECGEGCICVIDEANMVKVACA